jgi:hypothetical protein
VACRRCCPSSSLGSVSPFSGVDSLCGRLGVWSLCSPPPSFGWSSLELCAHLSAGYDGLLLSSSGAGVCPLHSGEVQGSGHLYSTFKYRFLSFSGLWQVPLPLRASPAMLPKTHPPTSLFRVLPIFILPIFSWFAPVALPKIGYLNSSQHRMTCGSRLSSSPSCCPLG